MARPFTGWVDDQGCTHATQEEAEAADVAHVQKTAADTVGQLIFQAINWQSQYLDLSVLLDNRATLIVNLEALEG